MNITELKAQADIVEILSQYVVLKKQGANYQARCPFHNEKSASFIVSPEKQIFTCFGCAKSGDIFTFLQEFKKIEFYEAAQEVADFYNLNIAFSNQKSTHNYKELYTKYESLFSLALQKLKNHSPLCEYLKKRGLQEKDLEFFTLGFMPEISEILAIFTQKEALELGILTQKGGHLYCPFNNRLIFALRNNAHKIIGISGRIHPYHNFRNAPKYVNSKESYLYKKSNNLYLFSQSKSTISAVKKAVIVEGYMDAIAYHKLGFKNAIATGGTAFNIHHINQIHKLNEDIEFCLCFDKDEAGFKATARAINLLLQHKIYAIKVFNIQGSYKDIAEVLEKQKEPKDILKQIEGIKYYIAYHLKKAESAKAKDNVLNELKRLIESESNFFAKNELCEKICNATNLPRDYFMQKQPLTLTPHLRAFRLLHAIFNNDEFFYIAQNCLDLSALPKVCQEAYNAFLQDKEAKIALDIALNPAYLQEWSSQSFYNEILSFNLKELRENLTKAKEKKDIPHILALTQKIQELHQSMASNALF